MTRAAVSSSFREAVRRCGATFLFLLSAIVSPASAHMQLAGGRILDLIQRSERLVIAKVLGPGMTLDTRRVLPVLVLSESGDSAVRSQIEVPARLAVQPGRSYAFFVTAGDGGWSCLQPAGTVLPAPHRGREFVEFDRALRPLVPASIEEAADVLLLGLAAESRELRLHAALALLDNTHDDHPLTAAQRHTLREILAGSRLDPSLRPALAPLAREAVR